MCMDKITQSKIIYKPQEKLATKIRKKGDQLSAVLFQEIRFSASRTPG